MSTVAGCPLCEGTGGLLVARGTHWRIVRANEPGLPAFYRVVRNDHVREFTDLDERGQAHCMRVVAGVERVLRTELAPAKVNIASLGNMVSHLHWHVVARFEWDPYYPGSPWSAPQRDAPADRLQALEARLSAVDTALLRIPL